MHRKLFLVWVYIMGLFAELANVQQKTFILLQTQITSEELSVEAKVGLSWSLLSCCAASTLVTVVIPECKHAARFSQMFTPMWAGSTQHVPSAF